MVLGHLDVNVQINESRSLSFILQKIQLEIDERSQQNVGIR